MKSPGQRIILAEDLADWTDQTACPVPAGALITPAAQEEADRRGIRFVEANVDRIAVGSDHGGFEMKEALLRFLKEQGFSYHDFGVFDTSPVDYPDVAACVARAVGRGHFRVGIIVDGAGIGSCMVANRIPGVLAAMCYDEATARNSREHNFSNVLTLGGRMMSEDQMRKVVGTWLSTPYGEERHRKRVLKILELDRPKSG